MCVEASLHELRDGATIGVYVFAYMSEMDKKHRSEVGL
jgi:hypothetical protein